MPANNSTHTSRRKISHFRLQNIRKKSHEIPEGLTNNINLSLLANWLSQLLTTPVWVQWRVWDLGLILTAQRSKPMILEIVITADKMLIFTFIHLADSYFIQSDIQIYTLKYTQILWFLGIEPMTLELAVQRSTSWATGTQNWILNHKMLLNKSRVCFSWVAVQ